MEIILIIVLILIAAVFVLQLWLIKRGSHDLSPLAGKLDLLQNFRKEPTAPSGMKLPVFAPKYKPGLIRKDRNWPDR